MNTEDEVINQKETGSANWRAIEQCNALAGLYRAIEDFILRNNYPRDTLKDAALLNLRTSQMQIEASLYQRYSQG